MSNHNNFDVGEVTGNVLLVDELSGSLIAWLQNTITETYKSSHAQWLVGDSVTVPSHIALGNVAALSTETAREFTKLKAEFARAALSSKIRAAPDTARLLALFTAGTGIGEVNEVGLFNSAVTNLYTVHICDAVGSWTSDNTLVLDTTVYREGTGSLKSTGPAALSFRNQALGLGSNSIAEATDYLQGWYFIDDASKLPSDGLFIELSSSTSDNTHEYQWNVAKAAISNNWNFLNLKLSSATKTGTPDLDALVRVRVFTSGVKSASVIERIDMLRLFPPTGSLWARAEPVSTITKGQAQVLGVYWFISASQGGTEVSYQSFAKESLSITTASTALTAGTYAPTGAESAKYTTIVVTKAPVRFWLDGSAPTSTTGLLAMPLSPIIIDNATDIANARFIRDADAQESAILEIVYSR